MKVLVCMLTDQHMPNLVSVHCYKPDRLILVETEETRRKCRARQFLNALNFGKLGYEVQPASTNCKIWSIGGAESVREIRAALQQGYEQDPRGKWYVNVTGGTKPMCIAAYDFSSQIGAVPIYVSAREPGKVIDLRTDEPQTVAHQPSVREFLAGYGWDFPGRPAPATWESDKLKHWRGWWNCARTIAEYCPCGSLLGQMKGSPVRLWRCDNESVTECVASTLGLQLKCGQPIQGLARKAWEFLEGKWLEAFVAGLLYSHEDHPDIAINDLRVGVEVPELTDEMDVVFMRHYALHYIECKSGAQEKAGEILRRIEANIRKFRALRVRTYLATTSRSRDVVTPHRKDLQSELRTRAEAYECRIMAYWDIQCLARNYDCPETVRKVIFGEAERSQAPGCSTPH